MDILGRRNGLRFVAADLCKQCRGQGIILVSIPEVPDIQFWELGPKYHTMEGILGPNSLMVVYVDPLGIQASIVQSR